MMFSNHSIHTIVALLLSSIGQVQQVHAQNQNWNGRATPVTCSICGDANRPILNPTQSFTMSNGNTWTCDYLQETVQDVDANASYENERLMCVQAQLQGENGGCQCGTGDATSAAMDNIQSQVSQSPVVNPVPSPSPIAIPLPTPSPVTASPVPSSLAEETTPLVPSSAPSRRIVSSNRPSARGSSKRSSGRPSSSGSGKGSGKSGSGKAGAGKSGAGKSGSGKSGSSSPSSASGSSRRSNGGAAGNDEVLLRSSEYAFVSSSPTTSSTTTIPMIALVSSVVVALLL